ncbi:MAG TPA: hypothetical protein VJ654_20975 [Noviherbaspirillum sp.]|nr:hypothetical protein [Noviherbaspirillum sp.]
MSGKRSTSVFIAACLFGGLFDSQVLAADLSIAPGYSLVRPTRPTRPVQERSQVFREENRPSLAIAKETQRSQKRRKRKIFIYSLANDPVFRLAGAVTRTSSPSAVGERSGFPRDFGYPMGVPPTAAVSGPGLKLRQPESSGIAFDCREKLAGSSPFRRSMTACYKFQVDRAWETQTYVSRGFAEDRSDWGGGLSVSYAH